MSKSRLTTTEKYTIQGMLANDKTHKEIADEIGRREKTVTKYIEGELDHLYETVTQAVIDREELVKPKVSSVSELINEAKTTIMANGLDKQDAEDLIEAAMKIADANGTVFKTSKQLSSAAIQRLNAKHLMGRKAQGGQKGVAIMTKAASERGDGSPKGAAKVKNRGTIYNPRTGEYN